MSRYGIRGPPTDRAIHAPVVQRPTTLPNSNGPTEPGEPQQLVDKYNGREAERRRPGFESRQAHFRPKQW